MLGAPGEIQNRAWYGKWIQYRTSILPLKPIKNYKIRFAYSCIAKRWGDFAEEVALPRAILIEA